MGLADSYYDMILDCDIMTNHRRQVVLLEVHLPLGRPLHGVFQVFLYQAIKTRISQKPFFQPDTTIRQLKEWVATQVNLKAKHIVSIFRTSAFNYDILLYSLCHR